MRGHEPGTKLAGRYVIVDRLGAGGMGVVLRARDERLGRDVAIKLLPAAAVGDAIARARLVREAQAAAALEHPGIVHVYDVGETEDGGAFLVMELVRGRSLRAALATGLARAEAVRVVRDVARALAFAHAAGFVHRDVKPDNVMIREDGRVVVLDFGVAKLVGIEVAATEAASTPRQGTLTADGALVGTPAYLAPEQASGEAVDAATDQFALAITAFELLTGELPWSGSTAMALVAAMLRDEPRRASSLAPGLPPEVDGVLARALARKREERFADVVAFADALVAAAGIATASPESPVAGTEPSLAAATSGRAHAPDAETLAPTDALAATVAAPPAIAHTVDPPVAHPTPATPAGPAATQRVTSRRRTLGAWLVVGAGLAAAGGFLVERRAHRGVAAAAPDAGTAGVLAAPNAVVACPPLRASGVPEPSGWFGALASGLACARIDIALGGHSARVLVPAELLDLPRGPSAGFPVDPYGEAGARDRAVAAAKARAAAWLDGEIARGPTGVHVTLVLRTADDREIARGEGSAVFPYRAVRAAFGGLAAALPASPPIDLLRRWFGATTADAALALFDLAAVHGTDAASMRREDCDAAKKRADIDPSGLGLLASFCDAELDPWPTGAALLRPDSAPEEVWRACTAPASEPSSEQQRACAAPRSDVAARELCVALGKAAAATCVSALADAVAREPSSEGRERLAAREASLREGLDQKERAKELYQLAVEADPKVPGLANSDAFRGLSFAGQDDLGYSAAFAAWRPWDALAIGNTAERSRDPQLTLMARSEVVAPVGFWANYVASVLLRAGKTADASAIIARTKDDALRVDLAASTARFAEALREATRTLSQISGPDISVAERTLEIATILRVDQRIAAGQARLVLDRGRAWRGLTEWLRLIAMCAQIPKEAARACLAFVRDPDASGSTPFKDALGPVAEGAERYARGDYAGAARAWRPLLTTPAGYDVEHLRTPMAIAFERSGDLDLAEKADSLALSRRGLYNGADLAYVRGALRAEKRGDKATARRLAQAVVDAWSVADDDVPAVDDMRKLLARLR